MTISLESLLAANSDGLKKLIERRHPDYDDSVAHWEFLASCYDGGRDWIERNIFSYAKEGDKDFAARKERAYRFPHTREVVNLVNKYVYKGDIARSEEVPNSIKEFWGASTLRKRPIQDYIESISQWSSAVGRVWVVVDNNYPADIVTEADRKNSNGRVYSYFIKPPAALDFAYDEDGELSWFLHTESYRDDKDPLTSSGNVETRYRLWTKEFTALVEAKSSGAATNVSIVPGSVREYDIGMVPIFAADHMISEEIYASKGLVEDVAYMDRAVTNYLSNLDAIIQDQTFSQLTIPFQGILPSEDDTDDEESNTVSAFIRMSTRRIFAYNAEGGVPPQYIAPDPKQVGVITDTISKIISEIYHSIGMAGERTKQDNAMGIDNSSGVAKAYDFERLNAMLAAKARSLQHIEDNIVRLVLAWHGDARELQDIESYVTYPTTFDVRSLVDEMDSAQRLSVMGAPKSLRRMQMLRLAKKMFPQATAEELSKLADDIENEWLELTEMELGDAPALPTSSLPGKGNAQGENRQEA